MSNKISVILNRESATILTKEETIIVCDSLTAYYEYYQDEHEVGPDILLTVNSILSKTVCTGFVNVHEVRNHIHDLDISSSELDNYENF